MIIKEISSILALIVFLTFSCSEKKEPVGPVKTENRIKNIKIKNKSWLIGVWQIDSITDTGRNSDVIKVSKLQGYIFKENGKAFLYEKTERSLKEILQGEFKNEKDSLNIFLNNGIIQNWSIDRNDNNKNITLKACFTLSPNSKIKPIVFLTKISYDTISM